MTYPHETIHPQHPHHLECPRCKRHTVVLRGETRYICLHCNWWRDVSKQETPYLLILVIVGLAIAFLLA